MLTTTTTDTRGHTGAARRLGLGLVAALALIAAAPTLDAPATDAGALERAAATVAVSEAAAGGNVRDYGPLP
jgi:hypothetical protein